MLSRDELAAWLRLATTVGIGRATARRLLAAFGSPERVLATDDDSLRSLVGNDAADTNTADSAPVTVVPGSSCQVYDVRSARSALVVALVVCQYRRNARTHTHTPRPRWPHCEYMRMATATTIPQAWPPTHWRAGR